MSNESQQETIEIFQFSSLEEFVNYCKQLNKGAPIKVGFSDDDKKNINLIEKHFGEPREMVDMTIKYTGTHGE